MKKIFLVILTISFLTACGQAGKLYLPNTNKQPNVITPSDIPTQTDEPNDDDSIQ